MLRLSRAVPPWTAQLQCLIITTATMHMTTMGKVPMTNTLTMGSLKGSPVGSSPAERLCPLSAKPRLLLSQGKMQIYLRSASRHRVKRTRQMVLLCLVLTVYSQQQEVANLPVPWQNRPHPHKPMVTCKPVKDTQKLSRLPNSHTVHLKLCRLPLCLMLLWQRLHSPHKEIQQPQTPRLSQSPHLHRLTLWSHKPQTVRLHLSLQHQPLCQLHRQQTPVVCHLGLT